MTGPGLRERKKLKTRQTIRREAYRLFLSQGYDATTVEQIAAAAEVSPSTFFRYFPTKEDVVLTDEYDPMIVEAVAGRPVDEPVMQTMRAVLVEPLRPILEQDRAELLARIKLIMDVPALRARMYTQQLEGARMLTELIAGHSGRSPGDLDVRVVAAACNGVATEVLVAWAEGDGRGDLVAMLDRGFAQLEAGLPL